MVLCLLLVGLVAASAAPPAEAAQRTRLAVSPSRDGVVVRLVGARPRRVAFVLENRVIARRGAPYRVSLRGLGRVRGRSHGKVVRLVVRNTRTGRRLASVRLAVTKKTSPAPLAPAANAPAAPALYAVPAGAVKVSSSAGLVSTLESSAPTDIALADGVYDNAEPFINRYGHRIYAENLGKAVLRAGLVFGGNWGRGGGLVRGVAFDIAAPDRTLEQSIIHVWGTGSDTQVLDVTLEGHGVLSAGISVRRPDGFVAQRVSARNFVDYGVLVDANAREYALSAPVLLEDIDVAGVGRRVPGSSDGTAEACVWVGNSATVRRVKARDCAWEGLWAGTAGSNSLFEDIDVDRSGVGVYVEHYVTQATFQRIRVGSGVETGLTCEWADPAWGRRPACTDIVIQDSRFESSVAGVYLDEGTTRTTIRRCSFVGQRWAAIGDYRGVGNVYDGQGNDYSGIAPGAVAVSQNHISTAAA